MCGFLELDVVVVGICCWFVGGRMFGYMFWYVGVFCVWLSFFFGGIVGMNMNGDVFVVLVGGVVEDIFFIL